MSQYIVIEAAGYIALLIWATFECMNIYRVNQDTKHTKRKKLRRISHTIFVTLLLFILGHTALFFYLVLPGSGISDYLMIIFFAMNFAILKGIGILIEEIQ